MGFSPSQLLAACRLELKVLQTLLSRCIPSMIKLILLLSGTMLQGFLSKLFFYKKEDISLAGSFSNIHLLQELKVLWEINVPSNIQVFAWRVL